MRVAQMLAAVREAMKYARMETMEVGDVCRDQAHMRDKPVRNEAGEIVTEANVSDFIRERLRLHHGSWIIGTLEGVSQELQSELPHSYKSEHNGFEGKCVYCDRYKSHRSHAK